VTKTSANEINIFIRRVDREKWREFQRVVPKDLGNKEILECLLDEVIAGRVYFQGGKLHIRL